MNLAEQPCFRSIARPLTTNSLPTQFSNQAYGETDQRASRAKGGVDAMASSGRTPLGAVATAARKVSAAVLSKIDFDALHTVSLSARIAAPTGIVFEKWCLFTELPHFMRAPRLVDAQESRMVWRLRAWNDTAPWQAAMEEMIPGRRISWKGLPGPLQDNRGHVTFEPMDTEGAETRITVTLELGDVPSSGLWLEAMATLVEATLANFCRSIHSPVAVPLPA